MNSYLYFTLVSFMTSKNCEYVGETVVNFFLPLTPRGFAEAWLRVSIIVQCKAELEMCH